MATLTIQKSKAHKVRVEIDLNQWEKLADIFGFYQPDFLKTIKKSLTESKRGAVKKIRSLRDLEKRSHA